MFTINDPYANLKNFLNHNLDTTFTTCIFIICHLSSHSHFNKFFIVPPLP